MKKNRNYSENNLVAYNAVKVCIMICSLFMLTLLMSQNVSAQQCKKQEASGKKPVTSVLKKCADKGDLEKTKAIIEQDEKLLNARLARDETILTIASYNGYYDIVKYLVEKGANVHLRNDNNNNALINASMQGHDKIVTLLLDNEAKINSRGSCGKTALHFAADKQHAEVVKILADRGCYINPQDDYQRIPLTYASWRGNAEVIKTLAENNADVNFTTGDNYTFLHHLSWQAKHEGMKALLEAGADANILNEGGELPLHNAVSNGNHAAVKLLLNYTKNINQPEKNYGNTPLHIAARNGDLISYKILTEAGADHNIVNNNNQKPLYYTTQYGQSELISYDISKGLATKQDIKLAESNRKASLQKTEAGNANVFYCGHSGWVVSTENNYLIFDYWSRSKLSGNPGLVNGTVNPDELKDKKVYVFVSHDHGDHYDTVIYSWQKQIKGITYIYGFKPEESWRHKKTGYHGPKYVYIENNQTGKVGNFQVTTLKSNDTGQGFLVEVDGVSIYHPGDHALFTKEDEADFKKEVDFIAGQNDNVDIAFLPVTGCPARWKKEFIVQGFFYSIEKLHPKQVMPMHAFNHEYVLQEFAKMAEDKKIKADVVCVENSGDNIGFNRNMADKQ